MGPLKLSYGTPVQKQPEPIESSASNSRSGPRSDEDAAADRPDACCRGIGCAAGAVGRRQAQELKIGYVNSERVLREAAPAKAAQAKLEAEFSKREKDLADMAHA